LSVPFTKEDSAETASEILAPTALDSPQIRILVTEAEICKALGISNSSRLVRIRDAQKFEDVNERLAASSGPLRDGALLAARVRTAQVVADPASTDISPLGARWLSGVTMDACRNIASWERTKRTPRRFYFLCISGGESLMAKLLGTSSAYPAKSFEIMAIS